MRFFAATTGDLHNFTMPSNYANYLHRRWNADRQIKGAVLWREYMEQYGAESPITIDVVRKLLREFRSKNFSSVSSQVDFPEASTSAHQLPETDDHFHLPKKPHFDGGVAAVDHHHYDDEFMEVEDFEKAEKKKVDGDKEGDNEKEESIDNVKEKGKDADRKEEEENNDEDEDEDDEDDEDDENEDEDEDEEDEDEEDEDEEDEDEDKDNDQRKEKEKGDNEKEEEQYDEDKGGVEKRMEKENNDDYDDHHEEEDDDISERIKERELRLDAFNDVLKARHSMVAALPSETKRAFMLYHFMSKF